jgi:ABC-type transport system involved in multi-copper enzyme maturation permease subunit
MFATILGFELRYHFRRPITWLYVVVFLLMGFLSTASEAVSAGGGTGQVTRNAPLVLGQLLGVLILLGQILTAGITGTAAMRDEQFGTQELLFTTRLSRSGYLLGRFLGSLAAMLVIYAAIPFGQMLGALMPWIPTEAIGPFRLAAFWHTFAVIGIPNLLFVGAVVFAVGTLTRKLFAVYLAGIAMLVIWQVSQAALGTLDNIRLAGLVDPYGLVTISAATRYWSIVEQNTMLLPLSGVLLQNRLLWLAVGTTVFAGAFAAFRLRVGNRGGAKVVKGSTERAPAMPAVTYRFDAPARRAMFGNAFRFTLRSITGEVAYLAIALFTMVNLGFAVWYASTAVQGEGRYWPVTATVAPTVANALYLFLVILITLYLGELLWRDRQQRSDQITDALPVSTELLVASRLAALGLALAMLITAGIATAFVLQLAQGYTRLEPVLMARYVFGFLLPTSVATLAFAAAVHAVVDQKFLGHVLLIGIYVGVQVAANFGLEHSLLQFLNPVGFTYSDMNGFGPYLGRWWSYAVWYGAITLVCLAVAIVFWTRGVRGVWRERWQLARQRFRGVPRRLAGAGVAGMAASGGWILVQSTQLHEFATARTAQRLAAETERRWKPLADQPIPRIAAVDFTLDLRPESRSATWHGRYLLVNRTGVPIDSVLVSVPRTGPVPVGQYGATVRSGLAYDSLVWSHPAALAVQSDDVGYRLYRFVAPLAPGDSVTVQFGAHWTPRGFPDNAFDNTIAGNGTFFSADLFPSFGYDANGELSDDAIRRKQGLAPKPRMKRIDDPTARQVNYIRHDADWVDFAATVCTVPTQLAVAPGYLRREWTENGRRCFRYEQDRKVLAFWAVLSAEWEVARDSVDGVQVEVYHHPWHTFAIPSMLDGAKDGLRRYGTAFTPYQFSHYRIFEFPRYASFAQAFPGMIPYSEAIGFVQKKEEGDDKIDLSYFVTAHELAHQWWAHQVVGADAQGATTFSEGLAEYSALLLMEQKYGVEASQKFLRTELDGYLRGRGTERKKEVPFLYVENQPYIHYQKGSLVYFALRDYIGEERLHAALRSFLGRWAFQGPPYPTARDLRAEIAAVTPDSLQYVLTDLFDEITLYEHTADSARTRALADGTHETTLWFRAKKLKADSLGVETPVAEADYVDVGIFGEKVPGAKLGKLLELRKVRVTGDGTARFVSATAPTSAGIDPLNKLIDRTPEDNVTKVGAAKR